jgi:hypothetical protein
MSLLGLCLFSGLDALPARADFTFGEPTSLGIGGGWPCISADDLELYLVQGAPGEIWVARRPTPDGEWDPPSNLGPTVNNTNRDVSGMSISADGLSLYFAAKDRPGGYGSHDLWVTSRSTVDDDWGTPVNLGATVNSASNDYSLSLSSDGLSLYFSSPRSGGYGNLDIWVTTRATTDDNWGDPNNLGPMLNTSYHEFSPSISSDGLLLFFSSTRPGGAGVEDLYLARRATTNDEWGPPVNLGNMINSTFVEAGVTISADGSMLYFHSNRPGGEGTWDMWQAPIQPVVDLNGDGIVDALDLCIVVEHWLTDEPLCDVGPMPWGDGIVDVQDLVVLAEHLFEEIPPAE